MGPETLGRQASIAGLRATQGTAEADGTRVVAGPTEPLAATPRARNGGTAPRAAALLIGRSEQPREGMRPLVVAGGSRRAVRAAIPHPPTRGAGKRAPGGPGMPVAGAGMREGLGAGNGTTAVQKTERHPVGAAVTKGSSVTRQPNGQNHSRVIAIDGPAAAGKSTVARHLAEDLGAMLFDTGSLYRAVTLAAIRAGVPFTDGRSLAALAEERHIDVAPPTASDGRLYDVHLDGEDVTWPIRDPDVEAHVSEVSAHPEVRAALLPVQRRIAAAGPVVMVGRDIGTVVVPDAGVKIFLEASLDERARRRHDELRIRGDEVDFAEVLADLQRRDAVDSGRRASPLRAAEGASVVVTDGVPLLEVVERLRDLVLVARRNEGEHEKAAANSQRRSSAL